MEETMNRLWCGFRPNGELSKESQVIPLAVVEGDGKIGVRVSLPGEDPGNIQGSIEDNVLTVRVATRSKTERKEDGYLMRERRSGIFHRSLRLPDSVDPEKAEASCESGVPTVSFPTLQAKKAKQLKISVGGGAKPIETSKK